MEPRQPAPPGVQAARACGGCVRSTGRGRPRLVYGEPATARGGGSGCQHVTRCGAEPLGDPRSVPAGGRAFLPCPPPPSRPCRVGCMRVAAGGRVPATTWPGAPRVSSCARQGPARRPGLHIRSGCFSEPSPGPGENEGVTGRSGQAPRETAEPAGEEPRVSGPISCVCQLRIFQEIYISRASVFCGAWSGDKVLSP